MRMVLINNQPRIEKDDIMTMTTNVFEDADGTQYLVTTFESGITRLAIREQGERTWSPPISLIRTERTETE